MKFYRLSQNGWLWGHCVEWALTHPDRLIAYRNQRQCKRVQHSGDQRVEGGREHGTNKEEWLWLVHANCMWKTPHWTLLAKTVHVGQSKKKFIHSKTFYLTIVMIETRDPSMGDKPSTIELHQSPQIMCFYFLRESTVATNKHPKTTRLSMFKAFANYERLVGSCNWSLEHNEDVKIAEMPRFFYTSRVSYIHLYLTF